VPAIAIERSTRSVEYRPEFIELATAEISTTLMMSAMWTPPMWNPDAVEHGDERRLALCTGRSAAAAFSSGLIVPM